MGVKRYAYKKIILRCVLTALCLLVFAWIFSNSLKSGDSSSKQSQAVVDSIQSAAGAIAPDSGIANATGKEYEKLHMDIRTLAHFSEFALLGALLIWCYFSYTNKKRFLIVPISVAAVTPFIDECLQTFSSGRAAEIADVAVDSLGLGVGMLLALTTLVIGVLVYRKKLKNRMESGEI